MEWMKKENKIIKVEKSRIGKFPTKEKGGQSLTLNAVLDTRTSVNLKQAEWSVVNEQLAELVITLHAFLNFNFLTSNFKHIYLSHYYII